MITPLTFVDHNRNIGGLRYIYPVVSRRIGAVSIGINLNVNNACNWRCIYCQVPNLQRIQPVAIDLVQLKAELNWMLDEVLNGDFMRRYVEPMHRSLQSLTFSGNGEPTMVKEFPATVRIAAQVLAQRGIAGQVKLRLISNGSQMTRPSVLRAIAELADAGGEVWFKVDGANAATIARINDVVLSPATLRKRLRLCALACPTWVQTCMFRLDGVSLDEATLQDYLHLLAEVADVIVGVHLYGLARPSLQPEAPRLTAEPAENLQAFAERIRALGIAVQVQP